MNEEIQETKNASAASQLWVLPDLFSNRYSETPSRGWERLAAPVVLFETTSLDEYSLLYKNGDLASLVKAALTGKSAFLTKGSPAKGEEASAAVARQAFAFLKAASLLMSCVKSAERDEPQNFLDNPVDNIHTDCSMLHLSEELLALASRNSSVDTILEKYRVMKEEELSGVPTPRWFDVNAFGSVLAVDPPGSTLVLDWTNSSQLNAIECAKGAKGEYDRGIFRDIVDDMKQYSRSPVPAVASMPDTESVEEEDEAMVMTSPQKTPPSGASIELSVSSEEDVPLVLMLRRPQRRSGKRQGESTSLKSTEVDTGKRVAVSGKERIKRLEKGVHPRDGASNLPKKRKVDGSESLSTGAPAKRAGAKATKSGGKQGTTDPKLSQKEKVVKISRKTKIETSFSHHV